MPDQSCKLEKLIFPFWSFCQLPKNLHLRLGTLRPMFCILDTWGTWGTWGYWDTWIIEAKVVSLPTSQDMTVIISDQLTADCQKIKAIANGSEVAYNKQWLIFNLLSAPLNLLGLICWRCFGSFASAQLFFLNTHNLVVFNGMNNSPTSKTL